MSSNPAEPGSGFPTFDHSVSTNKGLKDALQNLQEKIINGKRINKKRRAEYEKIRGPETNILPQAKQGETLNLDEAAQVKITAPI